MLLLLHLLRQLLLRHHPCLFHQIKVRTFTFNCSGLQAVLVWKMSYIERLHYWNLALKIFFLMLCGNGNDLNYRLCKCEFYFLQFWTVPILKRPITPPATLGMAEYQNTDHELLMRRLRPAQSVEEVILCCYRNMINLTIISTFAVTPTFFFLLSRLHILQFVKKHPGPLMTCRELLLLHYIKDLQSQAWTSILHTIHCFLVWRIWEPSKYIVFLPKATGRL